MTFILTIVFLSIGIIEGHMSNLESIYPEVQNIPKVKKVDIIKLVKMLKICEQRLKLQARFFYRMKEL